MKKSFFLLLLLSSAVFAQFTNDAKIVQGLSNFTVISTCTLDTTETEYTKSFSLLGFDKVDLYTYPLTAGIKLTGTSTATRKVSVFIQGSFDNSNFSNIDTISVSDSASTLILKGALNLNAYRMPFYRIAFTGTTGNVATVADVRLYAYRKDN